MLDLILLIIVAVVIVLVLFVALDYFAKAIGGDGRLWMLLKGLIVVAALVLVLQRSGVV
jgi:hypothetical protein